MAVPPQQREAIYVYLKQFGCKNVLIIGDDAQNEVNISLQKIYSSGQHTNWYLSNLYNKLEEMRYYIAEQNEICAVNSRTFEPFRNKFRGKKVVIVATGPSSAQYKPIPNAIHIGINFAWKNDNVKLDYLFTNDNPVIDEMKKGFDKISEAIFLSKFLERDPMFVCNYPEDVALNWKKVHRCYRDDWLDAIYQDICYHPLCGRASTVFCALHFALFTYPKEIYLVGCDAGSVYKHFYDQQEKGTTFFHGLQTIKVTWARMKKFARLYYPETEIISINPVGLKGLFRDIFTDGSVDE